MYTFYINMYEYILIKYEWSQINIGMKYIKQFHKSFLKL